MNRPPRSPRAEARARPGALPKGALPEKAIRVPEAAGPEELPADLPSSLLARLRLLVALDALLVEGSVTRAARVLDISTPAMSRLLSQLRALYGDEIVTRSGRGLVPTPFAERLRGRVRALTAEASDLLRPKAALAPLRAANETPLPLIQHAPLTMRSVSAVLEGQPDPATLARRLGGIGSADGAQKRLAGAIATIGAGAGQSRPLSRAEAEEAFAIVLDGEADPVQIGALLVTLQYRGATANELAGMVAAARRRCRPLHQGPLYQGAAPADLDWPAYRSPRNQSPPWFLLAARLVAEAGARVLLHSFGYEAYPLNQALEASGIPACPSLAAAPDLLERHRIAFLPVTAIDPQLQALLSLYRFFEMRSPLNLVVQLLNPLGAPRTLLGVPAAAHSRLHRDAAALLGWRRLLAVGSNRDLAQATPFRAMPLALLDGERQEEMTLQPVARQRASDSHTGFSTLEYWQGLWTGAVRDHRAVEIVVGTAALALMTLADEMRDHRTAREQALHLWNRRRKAWPL